MLYKYTTGDSLFKLSLNTTGRAFPSIALSTHGMSVNALEDEFSPRKDLGFQMTSNAAAAEGCGSDA